MTKEKLTVAAAATLEENCSRFFKPDAGTKFTALTIYTFNPLLNMISLLFSGKDYRRCRHHICKSPPNPLVQRVILFLLSVSKAFGITILIPEYLKKLYF